MTAQTVPAATQPNTSTFKAEFDALFATLSVESIKDHVSPAVLEFMQTRDFQQDIAAVIEQHIGEVQQLSAHFKPLAYLREMDEDGLSRFLARNVVPYAFADAYSLGAITHIELPTTGGLVRVFAGAGGKLGWMPKGRYRKGYELRIDENLQQFKRIVKVAPPTQADKDQALDDKIWRQISKYRRLAQTASNTDHPWIKNCLALPETREAWVAQGKKDPNGYGLTSGSENDGQVITLKRVRKHFNETADRFLGAWRYAVSGQLAQDLDRQLDYAFQERPSYLLEDGDDRRIMDWRSTQVPFDGYEASLAIWGDPHRPKEMVASLSVEKKGCAHGKYYLFVNDGSFIGHDVD